VSLSHDRLAVRLTARQYAALPGRPVGRPGWDGTRIVLLAAALVLLAGVAGLAGLGGYLIVDDFPSYRIMAGVPLVLLAVALRPRFGRLGDPHGRLDRERAPSLFALVDRVAAAIGAPPVQAIVVNPRFNASAGAVGLRRRRVLHLGSILSVRDETSLFASHPPTGLRAKLIESRPYQPGTVVLTDAEAARIDEELAAAYESARRSLAVI
jgi:hypothetical protein